MQKETKQTLGIGALVGSMFLSPLIISETIRDSRVFNVEGKEVWVSQNRTHKGNMEMYMGSGFAGHRWFDANNDGKLDSARWELATPRRGAITGNEKIADDKQALYEKARDEYVAGKGEIRGFEGIYRTTRDSLIELFR